MTKDELKSQRLAADLTRPELEKRMGWETKNQPGKRMYEYESGRRGITPGMATAFRLIFENIAKGKYRP